MTLYKPALTEAEAGRRRGVQGRGLTFPSATAILCGRLIVLVRKMNCRRPTPWGIFLNKTYTLFPFRNSSYAAEFPLSNIN